MHTPLADDCFAEKKPQFLDYQLDLVMEEQLDLEQLPRHVAIIMDGNGRWAKKRLLKRFRGHQNAIKAVRTTVETAAELKLTALTLYAFSTENWKRPAQEISVLMNLLTEYLQKELSTLNNNNIRLKIIGDRKALPDFVQGPLSHTLEDTSTNTGMVLTLALNYGGRAEMIHAIQSILKQSQNTSIDPQAIDEAFIAKHLYTSDLPDPDLIIRTSGEKRISNFLLWQSAYAEFYFTEVLWPDFSRADFIHALKEFQLRNRRMGGI